MFAKFDCAFSLFVFVDAELLGYYRKYSTSKCKRPHYRLNNLKNNVVAFSIVLL